MAGYRVGVDVGGTFTDVVLVEPESNSLHHTKTSSTPANPEQGAITGIRKILDETRVAPGEIGTVIHGTTMATNAVIERKGAKAGVIVTEGFGDILEIRRQTRPHMYDFREQSEPPVIPREHVYEVNERILADGSVRDELDEREVETIITQLTDQEVESVGVCLLHSYVNDIHERRVGGILENQSDMSVSLSVDILPEFKEYERTSTVAMNAYLRPVMDQYIDAFETGLAEMGIEATLDIMQSNGGMMTADAARERCVQTILSGPAAGALSGRLLTDDETFMTADLGGTSFDVGLSIDGELQFKTEDEISGHVLRTSMIDIETVGAGGGSIAWIDGGGALRVGPRSAGADPGPVAYGRGGTDPTVTDAHVVLGRLNQEVLLDGEMTVDLDGAQEAIQNKVAEPLELSLEDAAQGIINIVNANMVKSMRLVTVERGHDPRDFSLISFGGAGPLHGVELASELGMARSIIPVVPGVNSAVGLLGADYRNDYSETYFSRLSDADFNAVVGIFSRLKDGAIDDMTSQGLSVDKISIIPRMQVRYYGQGYNLDINISLDDLESDPEGIISSRFHQVHEREFGFSRPEEEIELVNVSLSVIGETSSPDLISSTSDEHNDVQPYTHRSVYVNGEWVDTPIYYRRDFSKPASLSGPLVVEQHDTTIFIPPDHTLSIDDYSNIVVEHD